MSQGDWGVEGHLKLISLKPPDLLVFCESKMEKKNMWAFSESGQKQLKNTWEKCVQLCLDITFCTINILLLLSFVSSFFVFVFHIQAYRNTVPVPRHWCFKRKYLQGKRGIEKAPFELPEFIQRTGIMEMRQALQEKVSRWNRFITEK